MRVAAALRPPGTAIVLHACPQPIIRLRLARVTHCNYVHLCPALFPPILAHAPPAMLPRSAAACMRRSGARHKYENVLSHAGANVGRLCNFSPVVGWISALVAIVLTIAFGVQIKDRQEVTAIEDLYVLEGTGIMEGSRMPDELEFNDGAWGISSDQFALYRVRCRRAHMRAVQAARRAGACSAQAALVRRSSGARPPAFSVHVLSPSAVW